MQTTIELTKEDFWLPIPILFDKLNNKKGASRFIYLFLLHYFYHKHHFPDLTNESDELLQHGITLIAPSLSLEEITNGFQNDRQIYRYKVELRQQINAGLNVVKNWNGANDFVYYGKSGEIASNCHDDQEISMLCLHLLQNSISYINTLLIENLFLDEYWWQIFGEEDYRALTALFYSHINPYGSFEVDLTKRLIIQQIITPTIEEVLA